MADFVKEPFSPNAQFLEPVIPTLAIDALSKYLTDRFQGVKFKLDDPTVAVCCDTSGSGKTTTVSEAAIRTQANRIIISPNLSPSLVDVLHSCSSIKLTSAVTVVDGLIDRLCVEDIFEAKFKAALEPMFERMLSLVQNFTDAPSVHIIDNGKCLSPPGSKANISQATFERMYTALNQRRLIVHVDDAQLFFKGVIPSLDYKNSDNINSHEIMALALCCFSKCISPFAGKKDVVWVFTGT
ncbi:hypothetical protein HDU84_009569 [Entophlyctis sp. JEL0112]|nr:hypothetical protein HDU84_009569 [Entophlyctis sp. JEL0112]